MVPSNVAEIHLQEVNRSKIVSFGEMIELEELCGFKSENAKLIYRASDDGFEAESFHAKCDDFTNILTLIKANDRSVFGGFTSQTWLGIGYKNDGKAFVFSFRNKANIIKKILISEPGKNAIFAHSSFVPNFGKNTIDLGIRSNEGKNSKSKLADAYKSETNNFVNFADEESFQVDEIEVYAIKI